MIQSSLHLHPLLGIEAPDLPQVHLFALPLQRLVQAAIAKPPLLAGQLPQTTSQHSIAWSPMSIAYNASSCLNHLARLPLTHFVLLSNVRDSLPPRSGRHHNSELMPLSMTLSNIAPASSAFNLTFSSSSAFSLRVSETSMPPNVACHLKNVALLIPCLRQTSASQPRPPVPAGLR